MIRLLYWYIRYFPIRKGKVPVLLFFEKFGLFKNKVKQAPVGHRSKMKLYLDDWVQQLIYFFGIYEFEKFETKQWIKLSAKSQTILDIGANVGYYSILSVDANSKCKVLAFEPAPLTYQRLVDNVNLNQYADQIAIFNLGLSDQSGELPLFLAGKENSGMTSLTQPDSFSGEVVVVPIKTVDQVMHESGISKVDLVKIDVEGNEFNVLKGFRTILQLSKPIVFIELLQAHLIRFNASVDDVFKFMQDIGYECFEYNKKGDLILVEHPKDIGLAIFKPKSNSNW